MISQESIDRCNAASKDMRKNILILAHQAAMKGAHLGSALSIVEIMSVLYLHTMKVKTEKIIEEARDRFILSKGHGALGYYTALYEAEIITKEQLFTFEVDGGLFPGQPSKKLSHGIEYSGGSLGLGLSYGCGIALAAKRLERSFRIFVLMGDGEVNEGTVWESAMFAKHNRLDNLTVIVDRNNMQSDGSSKNILDIDMESVWNGFGWNVIHCDGHNVSALMEAFELQKSINPTVVIADTIKGKGISFMENAKEWHHNRLNDSLYLQAMKELEEARED